MKYYIYSFKITDSNAFSGLRKIGFTGKADPLARVTEWEIKTGFKFELAKSWTFYCDDRFEIEKIERAIQRKFTNVTDLPLVFGREWYRNATDYDINSVVKYYQARNQQNNLQRQQPTAVDNRIRTMKSNEQSPVHRKKQWFKEPEEPFKPIVKKSKISSSVVLMILTVIITLTVLISGERPNSTDDIQAVPNTTDPVQPNPKEGDRQRPYKSPLEDSPSPAEPYQIPADSVAGQEVVQSNGFNESSYVSADAKAMDNDGAAVVPPELTIQAQRRLDRAHRKVQKREARRAKKEARKTVKKGN